VQWAVSNQSKNVGMDERYDRLTSKSDKPYLIIKAGNHQVIGQSQVYELVAARDSGVESVRKNSQEAEINDLT